MTNSVEQTNTKNDSKKNKEFKNRCYGLVIVKSENSNFNADFTGNARRLPDDKGTIYATDKALKYAIRRYWVDQGKDVFVWRSHLPNGNVRTREQRMDFMKDKLIKTNSDLKELIETLNWINCNSSKLCKKTSFNALSADSDLRKKTKNEVMGIAKQLKSIPADSEYKKAVEFKIAELKKIITATVFAKSIDTKLFGVTYTGEGPLSLTGPVQISYGINKLAENTNYTNDILSPYPTDDTGTTQSSIGKENKTLVSYYVYDFSVNPKNIISHYNSSQDIIKAMKLTENDIDSLKSSLKHSVTALDTTSKRDSENVMLLFIKMPEESKQFLPAMKNLVKITKNDNGDVEIDISKIKELTVSTTENGMEVELFYNDKTTKVSGYDGWENKGL